jgi:hypothetical protein
MSAPGGSPGRLPNFPPLRAVTPARIPQTRVPQALVPLSGMIRRRLPPPTTMAIHGSQRRRLFNLNTDTEIEPILPAQIQAPSLANIAPVPAVLTNIAPVQVAPAQVALVSTPNSRRSRRHTSSRTTRKGYRRMHRRKNRHQTRRR